MLLGAQPSPPWGCIVCCGLALDCERLSLVPGTVSTGAVDAVRDNLGFVDHDEQEQRFQVAMRK